jgi:hypothetical protein
MARSYQTSDVFATTPDGTSLRVRPLDAGDRDAFAAFFDLLGSESRLQRYLSPKFGLTPRELELALDGIDPCV